MKCLKIVTIVFLGINFASCGGDSSGSAPKSCAGTPLSDKSVTYDTNAGPITVNIHSNCTYEAAACNEHGTWQPTGQGQATFQPIATTCGDLSAGICNYSIVNNVVIFSCH